MVGAVTCDYGCRCGKASIIYGFPNAKTFSSQFKTEMNNSPFDYISQLEDENKNNTSKNINSIKPKALFGLCGAASFKLWTYNIFEVYSEKSKYHIGCDAAGLSRFSGSAA